jgi:hypothetical protein
MKRFSFRLLFSTLVFITLSGCETDFDITAPWKDITIVYGLISQNDSVHYIKVNKAFLGDGNAYTYAQIADSSSYGNNIEVSIIEIGKNGTLRTFVCDTTTVYNKEPGVFYYPQQVIYKTGFKVPSDYANQEISYGVEIRNKITGKIVSAKTPLVKDFSIQTPSAGQKEIEFVNESANIKWFSGKDGRRYNVAIRFWFDEVQKISLDTIRRSIDWNLNSVKSSDLAGNELLELPYNPLNFYYICNSLIPYDDNDTINENDVEARFADIAEIRIMVAGDELNTYMEVNEPSSGIVQDKPEYTNIVNGLGLFSCRYTKSLSKDIGGSTEVKLVEQDIKFVKKIGK